jgi:2'-5' RNA ligase
VQYAFEFCCDGSEGRRRPKKPETLFFAIRPDAETAVRVARLRDQFVAGLALKGTPLKTERLHVSLCHVGDYTRLRSRHIYRAKRAAKTVALAPFVVTFGAIASLEPAWPVDAQWYRRPLALLAAGRSLCELRRLLDSGLHKFGASDVEEFQPHMTLLYGPTAVPVQAIEPIRLAVDEFVLIHSERGLTRHHTIERWPLGRSP